MEESDKNKTPNDLLDSVEHVLDKDWPEWREKAKANWESMQRRDADLREMERQTRAMNRKS